MLRERHAQRDPTRDLALELARSRLGVDALAHARCAAETRPRRGWTVRELAPVMECSLTTAKEHWALARVMLRKLLDLPNAGTES